MRILVHRSLLRARLYLISPTPRILEVIILEKCGTGPELFNDLRREQMRSDIAMLRRLKSRVGCGFGRGQAPSGGYSSILPGKKECFIQPIALQPSPDFRCYGEQHKLYRHNIPDSGKVPIQSPARHWRIAYFYCYERTGIV